MDVKFKLVLVCFLLVGHLSAKPKVVVGVAPYAYFVKAIAKDMVEIETLLPSGVSPATFNPSVKQMLMLGKSNALIICGLPFEKILIKKLRGMLKKTIICNCSEGLELLSLGEHNCGGCSHDHLDPHVWMSPKQVILQLDSILNVLVKLLPDKKVELKKNKVEFAEILIELSNLISKKLEGVKTRSFYVFHPAYGYFAKDFGLTQIAIEHEGKEPGIRQLSNWIKRVKRENVKVIFVQPQFSSSAVQSIAKSINGAVKPMDPLAYDYVNNLLSITETFEQFLGDS
jgi:zinc transport system substrate-binding protein